MFLSFGQRTWAGSHHMLTCAAYIYHFFPLFSFPSFKNFHSMYKSSLKNTPPHHHSEKKNPSLVKFSTLPLHCLHTAQQSLDHHQSCSFHPLNPTPIQKTKNPSLVEKIPSVPVSWFLWSLVLGYYWLCVNYVPYTGWWWVHGSYDGLVMFLIVL